MSPADCGTPAAPPHPVIDLLAKADNAIRAADYRIAELNDGPAYGLVMKEQSRVQAGDPRGGQFAAAVRPEPEVTLDTATAVSVERPLTQDDHDIARTIYSQIGPFAAGNMDAKARKAYTVTGGITMTECRSGRKTVDVTVTLNGSDLYDVAVNEPPSFRATSGQQLAAKRDVHVADLQRVMYDIGDAHLDRLDRG